MFLAVTSGFVVGRSGSYAGKLWLLTLFFVPAAFIVGGQFYPEPIMALGILAGWERVRDGDADVFS